MKEWLVKLEMDKEDENYYLKLEKAGYLSTADQDDDMEHLKEITESELEIDVGVKKAGTDREQHNDY